MYKARAGGEGGSQPYLCSPNKKGLTIHKTTTSLERAAKTRLFFWSSFVSFYGSVGVSDRTFHFSSATPQKRCWARRRATPRSTGWAPRVAAMWAGSWSVCLSASLRKDPSLLTYRQYTCVTLRLNESFFLRTDAASTPHHADHTSPIIIHSVRVWGNFLQFKDCMNWVRVSKRSH